MEFAPLVQKMIKLTQMIPVSLNLDFLKIVTDKETVYLFNTFFRLLFLRKIKAYKNKIMYYFF